MGKAGLQRGLLDTPLLLSIQRGDAEAVQFVLDMHTFTALDISEFSALVLIAGAQDSAEQASRLFFLRHSHVHRITAKISRHAFALLSSIPAPAPITADDAIIAATALEHSLPLYTLDPARFAAVPGLATLQPY